MKVSRADYDKMVGMMFDLDAALLECYSMLEDIEVEEPAAPRRGRLFGGELPRLEPSPGGPVAEFVPREDIEAAFETRKKLGVAGPGYLGKDQPARRRGRPPGSGKNGIRQPKPETHPGPKPKAAPELRRTSTARRGRGGWADGGRRPVFGLIFEDGSSEAMAAEARRAISAHRAAYPFPTPDWTPVPAGEARKVEIDGGGTFEAPT